MPSVPIIPPYEPATGITQSPARQNQRRPRMGILSNDDAEVEAGYLPDALSIIKAMWESHSVRDIVIAIQCKTGFIAADSRLVYSLKARLDRMERQGS